MSAWNWILTETAKFMREREKEDELQDYRFWLMNVFNSLEGSSVYLLSRTFAFECEIWERKRFMEAIKALIVIFIFRPIDLLFPCHFDSEWTI